MRKQVFVCSGCSRPIYEGETVTHLLGEQWCARCIDKATEKAVKIHEPNGDQLLRPSK